ncbi:spermidine synthase [Amycolatopsis albispora]|uniref:Polyamine aminopropyltransferase n=1 Tax=Amycolatopsis albispora TaxID=1804986 RepID=A0A344L750_9PSEU|nr:spermidine synthase [Amycolatopsis albispora]AXB43874.1 spermidine synthase [Amycolatopsis albispora]
MPSIVEPVGAGLTRVWELDEVLADTRTAYQHLVIARTAQGVSLFCDDERQSTEASQLVYHEALMVPPLLLADGRSRVLVIGSSEGVATQIAVAAGAFVDHVDIDTEAVRTCAGLLPYGYSPAELAEAERGTDTARVWYRDGWSFLAETEHRYDVVVIDLPDENTDPSAQHNRLYGKDFLRRCAGVLAPGGVVCCQAGCPTLWRNETLLALYQRFTEVFATTVYFGSDEHEWAFLSGRADTLPDPVATMTARLATLPYRPSSVDAETLRGGTVPPYSLRHSGRA